MLAYPHPPLPPSSLALSTGRGRHAWLLPLLLIGAWFAVATAEEPPSEATPGEEAAPGDAPRVLFEGPPRARARFEAGRRVPVVCRNASEVAAEDAAAGAEHPREVLGPDDPRLMDAADLVDRVYANVGDDVVLTRGNRLEAWVTKLPLKLYQLVPSFVLPLSICIAG